MPYNYYTVSNTITHVLLITNTVAGLSPPYITLYSGYSFITNVTLYDYRESKTVNAIYLNVTNLSLWLTNDAPNGGSAFNQQTLTDTGHGINSIYIFNSVPMTSSTLPGVQVVSGAQLPPYGLAIATPQPIYVQGNYNSQTPIGSDAGLNNTTYTYPAALYADAVTVLSANWNDATESANLFMRIPVTTTVNTAIFQGIVPSSGSNYSGGLENSIRLLENWGSIGVSLYYNGSFVVMFPSQYATNFWSGSVYGVPTRHWAFDSNFTNPAKLPPLTPRVVNYVTP